MGYILTLAFYSSKDGGGMADVETKSVSLSVDELKEIGDGFHAWRMSKRLTLRDLSKEMKIKPSLLSSLERGCTKAEIIKFEKL